MNDCLKPELSVHLSACYFVVQRLLCSGTTRHRIHKTLLCDHTQWTHRWMHGRRTAQEQNAFGS